MSVQVMSWVLDYSETTLGTRLVLLSIANHASHDGDSAYPSIDTISRESRVSRRQVIRCIQAAESMGELKVNRGEGRGHSNLYSFPKYANLSPLRLPKDDIPDTNGDISDSEKVTFQREKVTEMSPDPSLTVQRQPSITVQEERTEAEEPNPEKQNLALAKSVFKTAAAMFRARTKNKHFGRMVGERIVGQWTALVEKYGESKILELLDTWIADNDISWLRTLDAPIFPFLKAVDDLAEELAEAEKIRKRGNPRDETGFGFPLYKAPEH